MNSLSETAELQQQPLMIISSQDRDELLGAGEATSLHLKREKLQVTWSFLCEKFPTDFNLCVFSMDPFNA